MSKTELIGPTKTMNLASSGASHFRGRRTNSLSMAAGAPSTFIKESGEPIRETRIIRLLEVLLQRVPRARLLIRPVFWYGTLIMNRRLRPNFRILELHPGPISSASPLANAPTKLFAT
jgi:hypothetical protein